MCRLWWFFNSYWRLMSSPVSVPVFMCTQVWSPHLEQTVSLGPLSVSLLLIKGFTLDVSSSSTVGPDLLLPVVLKSIFIWRTMMMQTWAHVELPYHFSVPWWPLANGCLPGSCSMFQSVLPQGLGTSSLPLFTHLAHQSSTVVPPKQQPHFLLTLWAHVLRTYHMLLTVTFHSAEDCTMGFLVLLGAICLHGTGILGFLRWASLSLQPSLSWSGPHSTQVSNSTLWPRKVLPA